LRPIRPTFFPSWSWAIPAAIVTKMIGATTIRIARMKASPRGFMSEPTFGQKCPTIAPTTTPMMTCMYNDLGRTLSMPPPVFFLCLQKKARPVTSRLRLRDGSGHGSDGLCQRIRILLSFRSCDHAPDLFTLQRTADHVTRLALIEVGERDMLSAT